MRPVGSDPDEARDHEGKLMAEKNHSVAVPSGNGDTQEADSVDLLGRAEQARAEKRAAEAALARHVVWTVEQRMARATRAPRLSRSRQGSGSRPEDWKGPSLGAFREVERLREATLNECRAGYRLTWGREFDAEATAHGGERLVGTTRKATDAEAREIYMRLQGAIREALEFAWQHPTARDAPAAIALDALRGLLPALPLVSELPGYKKAESGWAAFVRRWQSNASQILGRPLAPRELAELAILIDVAEIPYREEIDRRGKATAAQIIDWAKKRILQHLPRPT